MGLKLEVIKVTVEGSFDQSIADCGLWRYEYRIQCAFTLAGTFSTVHTDLSFSQISSHDLKSRKTTNLAL